MVRGMASLFDTLRFLTDFDSNRMGHILTDVLVVGSGVAGARAALEAARFGSVILVTKSRVDESATRYAQGGIAVAIGSNDSIESHFEDTIRVGCGMNDAAAVRTLVGEAPLRIEELIEWGLKFDRDGNSLALGREGGHRANRIVHVGGDQTGRALAETLNQRVDATEGIRTFEHCFVLDLLVADGECIGAVTFHPKYGHQLVWAKQTIIASGGCGRLWRETTNPAIATGDGIAAAFRAGAAIRDLELMQFHPTTLYVAGAGRALISEAVRGEGAYLVDHSGNRFMTHYHPDGELAPRDIVSRAIHLHLRETRTPCVYLDVRHLSGFAERFPHITALCRDFKIDPLRDRIPVRPSAHYSIGGVIVDLDGRSSIDGLLVCGEAASSGVHGANRIASNSLLEGLVFGARAGKTAGERASALPDGVPLRRVVNKRSPSSRSELDLPDIRNSLRSLMWRNVGIVRNAQRLRETCDILDFWAHYTLDKTLDHTKGWETQNELTVARLVAMGALSRESSIGVHYRDDGDDSVGDGKYHLTITRSESGTVPQRTDIQTTQTEPRP